MLEIDVCPRWLLNGLHVPADWHRDAGVWLSSLLALFAPFALIQLPHLCLMRTLLHIPCPGCGVMHALRSLLELRPGAAWRANPGGIGLGAALLVQIGLRPMAAAKSEMRPAVEALTRWAAAAAAISLGVVWIERLLIGGW